MYFPIYLDYAATTPVDATVAQQMAAYLTMEGGFGNPASGHHFGSVAKAAVEQARVQLAGLVGAMPSELIWTSGATEANNLALKGAAQLYQAKGKHIITMQTEHPSVLDCCQHLEKQGYSVTYLAPEKNGLLNIEKLRTALRTDTFLVSIMHVNNETGIIQDIEKIASLTAAHDILFHVDAVQSLGKIPINLTHTPVDLMSFSAHKIYGPKGVGALYVRRKPRVKVAQQIHGGGHEQGMRSGTLATHQIVGMGWAAQITQDKMTEEHQRITALRNAFLSKITACQNITINTDISSSIPHIINIKISGLTKESFKQLQKHLAISAGSACHAKGDEPSYVLRAMGQSALAAACGVRISLGRYTTMDEIQLAAERLVNANSE